MIDPELKNHLIVIEGELVKIRRRSTSTWQSIWHGVAYGMGYIVGAAIIVIIIGWILNIIGVIPALSQQVTQFRNAVESVNGR